MRMRSLALLLLASLPCLAQLPASDDFNRSDENPITGNWTDMSASGNVTITGNQFSGTGNFGLMARWNADAPNPDQYSQIDVIDTDTGYVGPACRLSSVEDTGYIISAGDVDDTIYVSRLNAGVLTELTNMSQDFSGSPRTLRVECFGTGATVGIRILVDGTQVGSVYFDSSAGRILSGGIGISSLGTESRGDNWQGGNLIPPTASPTSITVYMRQGYSKVLTHSWRPACRWKPRSPSAVPATGTCRAVAI